jgi:hypothetical protein
MTPNKKIFKFQPMSHSWGAIHPQPKGIIQFIGGAFFGSVPTVYYRYFLNTLFEAGYTIIALPFRFTMHHWSVALDLLEEHYRVRQEIINHITGYGNSQVYDYEIYLKSSNYVWVGHSLGCKYVILLEILNDGLDRVKACMEAIAVDPAQYQVIQSGIERLSLQLRQIEQDIQQWTGRAIDFGTPGIANEASLLIAPVITDLNDAIPIRSLAKSFASLGVQVFPTIEQTHKLVSRSQSFNLMQVIRFQDDDIARETCDRLLKEQSIPAQNISGKHLEPVGMQMGNYVADFNLLDKFFQPIDRRQLEATTLQTLDSYQRLLVQC